MTFGRLCGDWKSAARVALVGLAQGWGEAFCVEVFRAQFGGSRRIDEPATLIEIVSGLSAAGVADQLSAATIALLPFPNGASMRRTSLLGASCILARRARARLLRFASARTIFVI